MGLLDYERLIAPLDGNPVGPNLRDEPDFRDIEDAPGGFANLKAPDLKKTIVTCNAFLGRTKDQAPAIVALQAAVRVGDFTEANTALRLIKGYAEEYWEDFHPGPAEEMLVGRINELTALTRPAAMTLPLQRAGLARLPAPSTIEFTAQMIAQACTPTPEWSEDDETELQAKIESGQITAANARTMKPIREGGRTLRMLSRALSAAAREDDATAGITGGESGDPEAARKLALFLRETVTASHAGLADMSNLLYEIAEVYQAKGGDSPSFGPIYSQIKAMQSETEKFLEMFPEDEGAVGGEAGGETAGGGGEAAAGGGPAKAFTAGVPRSRSDVVAALDMIGRYYADSEPTSPVPIILRRVRNWVHMDFMQLMNEINPSGVDEVRSLLASREE